MATAAVSVGERNDGGDVVRSTPHFSTLDDRPD
jgi:hypothetical protein